MSRKITAGAIRNKERTKQKLIDSVGEIIEKEGFSNITISNIGRHVKHDKKLIYQYYGGVDELVKAYLNTRNFWELDPDQIDTSKKNTSLNSGKHKAYQLLENQFDNLMGSGEMRGVIAWELSEETELLKEKVQVREELRKQVFSEISEHHFKAEGKNTKAIEAILMSSIYYLTLHAHKNGDTFNGIDIKQKLGQQEIKNAIKQILEYTYL